jgi:hypothetical protein
MVLPVSFVLSPATNSFCHRRRRIKGCLSPVGPTRLRRFDISNGCQDHTTSPYALAPFVSAPLDRSQAGKTCPAIAVARLTLPRPSHPASNVRDDREAPLLWERDTPMLRLIWGQDQLRHIGTTGKLRITRMRALPVGRISTRHPLISHHALAAIGPN